MSSNFQGVSITKEKTTPAQWIVIGLIIIIFIVIWIIIWVTIVNKFFSGSGSSTNGGTTPGCTVTGPPGNLTAQQNNLSTPNIELSWDAVLFPQTNGETILGYNVYSRETSGITKTNTASVRANTFSITLVKSSSGDMTAGTEVFFRVATVDTCGEGALSEEISFTPQ